MKELRRHRLGVVYTPCEIVRFIVASADWLCDKHFTKSLIDKNVEILDPELEPSLSNSWNTFEFVETNCENGSPIAWRTGPPPPVNYR